KEALHYLREHAQEFNINPNQITVVGFSAGGNLALRLATTIDEKPNALVLGYAASEKLKEFKQETIFDAIDEKMPPTFLFHTAFDATLPSSQSLKLALRLQEKGIPFETHIFLTGDHGLSLAIHNTGYNNKDVAKWHELSLRFLDTIFHKTNYIWGDLIDEKPSIKMRNDILLSKQSTKRVIEKNLPEHMDKMVETPFFASLSFERYAKVMQMDAEVVSKIKEELRALE
ncbi:MAG: alpha/beta hydrolase, partial [Solobacterium sp.]|nr:alpha/beta hydrolase [Solobacterium sp.]